MSVFYIQEHYVLLTLAVQFFIITKGGLYQLPPKTKKENNERVYYQIGKAGRTS